MRGCNQVKKAREWFQRAINVGPDNANAYKRIRLLLKTAVFEITVGNSRRSLGSNQITTTDDNREKKKRMENVLDLPAMNNRLTITTVSSDLVTRHEVTCYLCNEVIFSPCCAGQIFLVDLIVFMEYISLQGIVVIDESEVAK
ncbi:hypothetical protein KIN20_024917 [Parelaphostrongylus tenuis]|uniref:Uncharacterized protein n=1 Tax=Parelaphostrongylus tenuis TaxID=148309 RepID=A0AAD5N841_PARTN|nr:hypothetical protein KIN20_024917 [Parelaphostrongylus tenuis]